MKLEGTTFVISGGSSGLGLETARSLHRAGAYVLLLDLDSNSGDAIVKELGARAKFIKTDVTDTASIKKAVSAGVEWTKETGKPFGGVVAAAGVAFPAKVSYLHFL